MAHRYPKMDHCAHFIFEYKLTLDTLINVGASFLFGLFAFWLSSAVATRKERINDSVLGVAIIDLLIEEVNTGLAVMATGNRNQPLPAGSWSGVVDTIPGAVLMRIIATSRREPTTTHWHPSRILEHSKNYFENITRNWLNPGVDAAPLVEGSQGVLGMLIRTRELLLWNSRRWRPV